MSELLKLKFEPYYIREESEEGWKVDVVYVDKNLAGERIEVFKESDGYRLYSIDLGNSFIKLKICNPQVDEIVIYSNKSGCFVKNKNLEKTKNALEILKPAMKRRYDEIVEKKQVEKEWQEQKSFELTL
ncbi:hypothetical protein [Veillonella sp. 3310]|uniref:hypothetical protein n=1 Tax=Veillonella sp. 3310 TaxID=2490956 RepID=UPI000FD6406E|nr:hypothetical protein [Veillonella sp. 3310]